MPSAAFPLLGFCHEMWGFSRTTWVLGFFARKLGFFEHNWGFFQKKDEIWDFAPHPPPPVVECSLSFIERGGQPLDVKNFDLHPPPGREFRTKGKDGTFGAWNTIIWYLSGVFWRGKTGVFWVFGGPELGFFSRRLVETLAACIFIHTATSTPKGWCT